MGGAVRHTNSPHMHPNRSAPRHRRRPRLPCRLVAGSSGAFPLNLPRPVCFASQRRRERTERVQKAVARDWHHEISISSAYKQTGNRKQVFHVESQRQKRNGSMGAVDGIDISACPRMRQRTPGGVGKRRLRQPVTAAASEGRPLPAGAAAAPGRGGCSAQLRRYFHLTEVVAAPGRGGGRTRPAAKAARGRGSQRRWEPVASAANGGASQIGWELAAGVVAAPGSGVGSARPRRWQDQAATAEVSSGGSPWRQRGEAAQAMAGQGHQPRKTSGSGNGGMGKAGRGGSGGIGGEHEPRASYRREVHQVEPAAAGRAPRTGGQPGWLHVPFRLHTRTDEESK